MDYFKKNPGITALVAFLVGLFIGLVVLGWGLMPVKWTDSRPHQLSQDYQELYIQMAADAYASTGDTAVVQNAFRDWPDAATSICAYAGTVADPAAQANINNMAMALDPQGCPNLIPGGAPVEGEQPAEEGGTNIGVILLLLLLLVLLAGAIVYVLKKRSSLTETEDDGPTALDEMGEMTPATTDEFADRESAVTPLARFQSNYSYGRDNYDDSFSIENTDGDFLGECGVGVSETLGTDTPKNVTAFEVWLFDKNDIRTETKVVMSDHAYFDEALKAKLAPKGEPVLARENEVIVLETATLIVNATIKEMQYGTGDNLPPQSFFDSFTIELSAWAKDDNYSQTDDTDTVLVEETGMVIDEADTQADDDALAF
ncbi:MAG TPA: hypothetical protein ENJ93_05705 [Chloroflexi bacterium]|nr:hypothetical protein [Chloroflexota bacterium]